MKKTLAKAGKGFAGMMVLGAALNAQAQIGINSSGTYSNNFDSLISTGTTTAAFSGSAGVQTEVPSLTGWYVTKNAGSATNVNLVASDGSATSGAVYSFGANSSSDRALGALASGSVAATFGAWFTNTSSDVFTSITLTLDAEVWRSSNTQVDTLTFAYGLGGGSITSANFLYDSTMTADSALNVVGPAPVDPNGALDGNANPTPRTLTIDGINWAPGSSFFIRWSDTNNGGNDAGLAIDNFTFTAIAGMVSSGTTQWTGALLGGDGTWSASPSDTSWDFGSAWDSSKTALFDLEPGTITIADSVDVNFGINFVSDGNVITSGTMKLGGAVDVTLNATINSVITGTSGLTKTGSGRLVLGGNNTFTGPVRVNGGLLQIADEANLGNAANDIVLNTGGLSTVANLTLGAGRDISGAGSLDIADLTTLTINGAFNTSALTLLNSGTLYLGGGTRSVGNLIFNAGATVDGAGTITGTGLNATNLSGTARVKTDLNLGSANITVDVGEQGVLALDGDLVSSVGIQKTGLGILELNGNNETMFRVRIGAQGTDGGTVRIATNTALGANQTFFNSGRLEATADLTGANAITTGVSIGALDSAPAVFSGSNMTFTGSSGLFETAGSANRINVENTTTFTGTFTQGATAGTGVVIGGSGTLKFSGDASGMTRTTTVTEVATLVVDGSFGGAVTVDSGAALKGSGTLLGLIEVSGVHAVGNSAGIQTAAGGVSYLSGSTFEWELVGNSNATAGVDFDQLIVSGGNISIASNVTMDLIFNSAGSTVDWNDSFWDTNHSWTLVDNTGGGLLTGEFALNSSSQWYDANGFLLSAIDSDADFVLSSVNGDIILTYYAVPIPEPTTGILLAAGGLLLVLRRRR